MNNILFGSDPEGFFSRKDDNGELVVVPPAKYRLDFGVKTTGEDPRHPIFSVADGQNGKVNLFEDGAAFEVSIAPSSDITTLYQDIQLGYKMAEDLAKEFGDFVSIVPTIKFDTKEFRDRKKSFKNCLIFGCDMDWDVFEIQGLLDRGNPVEDALLHPFRYGGGHLHISGSELFQKKPLPTVKMCAFLLGNLVTFLSPMKKLDHDRTYRYGRPGRFRIQEYGKKYNNLDWTDIGIEYRTPSNAWTTDLSLAKKMADVVHIMADFFLPNDSIMESLIEDLQDNTIKAVMEGIPELAEKNFNEVMSWVD